MPIQPADRATRLATFDILSRFLADYDELKHEALASLRDGIYSEYNQLSAIGPDALHRQLNFLADVDMRDNRLFLYLEPTRNKKILPLITIHSSDCWIHFRIYALLTLLDDEAKLRALAVRFETDEGSQQTTGSHDFCHAQLCNSIDGYIFASTPPWLPDSQPSIPVDAENQVSLVLCMLTSLYGGDHVRSKLTGAGDRSLRKHLSEVRALR